MLTNRAPSKRVELPHEPGAWVEVRPLSWRQLEQAREARLTVSLKRVSDIDVEALRSLTAGQDRSEITASLSPADTFDVLTVLRNGIAAWSYDELPTDENIEALDQETVDVVLAAILPQPKTEADRKNGSASSTSPSSAKAPRLPTGS